jgi:hypothetical protein
MGRVADDRKGGGRESWERDIMCMELCGWEKWMEIMGRSRGLVDRVEWEVV